MGYKASQVKMSYEMARMLPSNDSHFVEYENFKQIFGEDGNVIFIGFTDQNQFNIKHFDALHDFCEKLQKIDGVANVLSITNLSRPVRNDSLQKFTISPLITHRPETQKELDSIKSKILSLRFFEGMLFNKKTHSYMIGVTLEKSKINDKSRITVVENLKTLVKEHEHKTGIQMHCSGLPYIRTVITQMIQHELYLFIAISLIVSALLMVWVFRSAHVVMASLIVVIISVIWALGLISLFGYKISILIGVMPSLLIIVAIENCIFFVNKYHWEFRLHGNKIKSLSRVVSRIGFATFMTNVTTAAGFAAFIFTSNKMMQEFGIVSSITMVIKYVLSLILTVIILSYLPAPKQKHTKHLDRRSMNFVIDWIISLVFNHRKALFISSILIVGVCVYGVTKMEISGKLVDDIPDSNPISMDLKFFEKNMGGVMPFEIIVDTKKPKGLFSDGGKVIYKIKMLQKEIKNDSSISKYFSRPLSIVEAVSFANQAYHNENPKFYMVPPPLELAQLSRYVGGEGSKKNSFSAFIDSNKQITRVSIQIADIGTKEMNRVLGIVVPKVDSIFPSNEFNVTITGNSIVHAKGTEFLINNLWESIIIGIILISLLIALTFSSLRMIVIAMVVNLIPLLVTAAIMGFFAIPIKPSTIIVFSIALGISIDSAIMFLAQYRHEIRTNKHNISDAVRASILECGFSIIYSSIVLIVGFAIYMLSGFGGVKALGFMISITLLFALFFNIILLPAFLLSLEKKIITPAFEVPIIDIDIAEQDKEDETDNES